MIELVFATGNSYKIKEVYEILGDSFQIKGLKDIGCTEEIPETQGTIQGNAIQKAQYVFDHYGGLNCFSEDTGLEVYAINNEPGVDTAYYAGPQRDANDNMNLLLQKLADKDDRKARFRTVIALILNGNLHTFEGIVEGEISLEKKGNGGFGYDPIFIPEGYEQSFGELPSSVKNEISHRGRAVAKLVDFLRAI